VSLIQSPLIHALSPHSNDESYRKFAVSTLASSAKTEYSPNAKRSYSPSTDLNPKGTRWVWAARVVRWAGGGGWRDESWNDLPLDVWPF
jgi:hypothetical protein